MKKVIITTVQALITVAILVWVFHDPQKRAQMAEALGSANKWWMLAAFAVYGGVEVCATVRWYLLLAVQDIRLSKTRTFMLLMVGVFFNLFLPGGTGGDVVKIFYLLKETPGKKAGAFLSVLMDRLIGLLALITLTGVLVAWNFDWVTHGANPF